MQGLNFKTGLVRLFAKQSLSSITRSSRLRPCDWREVAPRFNYNSLRPEDVRLARSIPAAASSGQLPRLRYRVVLGRQPAGPISDGDFPHAEPLDWLYALASIRKLGAYLCRRICSVDELVLLALAGTCAKFLRYPACGDSEAGRRGERSKEAMEALSHARDCSPRATGLAQGSGSLALWVRLLSLCPLLSLLLSLC